MADMLAEGLTWLADQLVENVSTTVLYKRGAASVSLQATLGSSLLRTQDRAGNSKTERTDRDFLIRVADLILSSVAVKPDKGDRVQVTFGAVTTEYEVMPVGGEPEWRYSDPHQTMFRIHTKFKRTV